MGIRFDNHLTFSKQIEYLKSTCANRLNIIKILSHKSWKLDTKTLINIYNSLVRSVIEYSAILLPALSETNAYKLQIIQNTALRSILHMPYDTNIAFLHTTANVKLLSLRLEDLVKSYITSSIITKNPLLMSLFVEYKSMLSRPLLYKTLLCPFKNIFQNIQ